MHKPEIKMSYTKKLKENVPLLSSVLPDTPYAAGLLPIRFIQGFIYWGGGSRRFIYAPSKLDPSSHVWMANKFQTAMPGALLGMDHVVSVMLQHFWLLYPGVILFSAAELIVGLMLMAGFLTRLASLVSMIFAVLLMLMFGWQGATCIDEWTMAACNLAMGGTLLLMGSRAYAMDGYWLQKSPQLANAFWFRLASGILPLPFAEQTVRRLALGVFTFVICFDVATYSYYRGSVITPFHKGPVSPTVHHLSIDHAEQTKDGTIRFHVYLDAGTPEAPIHIVQASILDAQHHPLFQWNAQALSALPRSAFQNDYAYNIFSAGPFGIRAPMGAKATITLTCSTRDICAEAVAVQLTDVDGRHFEAPMAKSPSPDKS